MYLKISFENKIKIILITIIAIITYTLVVIFDNSNSYNKKYNYKIDQNNLYKVINVIDGDTVEIQLNGNQKVFVRMLGIDTPETVDPRKTVQCFGKEASNKTKELLFNKNIILELDKTQYKFDKYGRVLAYIKREDGLFINQYLIENGFAYEYTYNIPYKYQKEFKALQKQAKKEKRGLWGDKCNLII